MIVNMGSQGGRQTSGASFWSLCRTPGRAPVPGLTVLVTYGSWAG
jgi:hypothetical protein